MEGWTTVFWKRHTERPLFSDPMIQNMILPQTGLAHDKTNNNAIQGEHCVLETPYRETIVFGFNDSEYYTTSDWLGPGQNEK